MGRVDAEDVDTVLTSSTSVSSFSQAGPTVAMILVRASPKFGRRLFIIIPASAKPYFNFLQRRLLLDRIVAKFGVPCIIDVKGE